MLALDRAQRGCVQFLTFMSQYICHATSACRKAGRLFTNKSQFIDRLSTNTADHVPMHSRQPGRFVLKRYFCSIHRQGVRHTFKIDIKMLIIRLNINVNCLFTMVTHFKTLGLFTTCQYLIEKQNVC